MTALEEEIRNGIGLGFGVEVMVTKIGRHLDTLSQTLEAIRRRLESGAPPISPRPRKISANYTTPTPALTYSFIDLGGPSIGDVWDVRRYQVSGLDPFTSITGAQVLPFITSTKPPDSGTELPGFLEQIDAATSIIPNAATWSRDEVTLSGAQGERLVLAFKGLTAGQVILVSGQVVVWRDTDRSSLIAP